MDEHGPGGECRRLKQSIILRPVPALGIAAICVFLLTSSFHTPNAVQDGPVTEHVIQGVVKSAVVEEVAAMALFLASDESGFCTGGQFPVEGGTVSQHPKM